MEGIHYVCTGGCGGMLPDSGVCQAADCPNTKKPMEACACADGFHKKDTRQDLDSGNGEGDR